MSPFLVTVPVSGHNCPSLDLIVQRQEVATFQPVRSTRTAVQEIVWLREILKTDHFFFSGCCHRPKSSLFFFFFSVRRI